MIDLNQQSDSAVALIVNMGSGRYFKSITDGQLQTDWSVVGATLFQHDDDAQLQAAIRWLEEKGYQCFIVFLTLVPMTEKDRREFFTAELPF